MTARKYLSAPLLMAVLLFSGCFQNDETSYRTAPQAQPVYMPVYAPPPVYASPPAYAAPQSSRDLSAAPPSGGMRSLGTVSEGGGIIFKITPDGPAQRVEWWSPGPSGANSQICFETNGRTILCGDVDAGSREGVLYAFGDINLAGATAVFRSAP